MTTGHFNHLTCELGGLILKCEKEEAISHLLEDKRCLGSNDTIVSFNKMFSAKFVSVYGVTWWIYRIGSERLKIRKCLGNGKLQFFLRNNSFCVSGSFRSHRKLLW